MAATLTGMHVVRGNGELGGPDARRNVRSHCSVRRSLRLPSRSQFKNAAYLTLCLLWPPI